MAVFTIIAVLVGIVRLDVIVAQDYIQPEYVRADQFGTAYFRADEPRIGPTKSRFHIENLVKLENELVGLGEIIIETEKKLHLKEKLAKNSRMRDDVTGAKVLATGASSGKDATSQVAVVPQQEHEHSHHDYSQEIE